MQNGSFFRTLIAVGMAISLSIQTNAMLNVSSGIASVPRNGSDIPSSDARPRPIRVLMVGGGESHDFNKWYRGVDAATLREGRLATVVYIDNTDSILHYLKKTDVLLLSNNQPISDPNTREAIFNHVKKGKGLVLAHAALWYNWKDWPEYNLQLAGGGSRGHDRYGSFQVTVTSPSHPVMDGLPASLTLADERYYYIPDPASPGVEVLATASAEGAEKSFPSIFVVKHPKARIVGIALGHDGASHDLPEYQALLRNAVKWVSKRK